MRYFAREGRKEIGIDVVLREGLISKIRIAGDFFVFPEEALEAFEKSLIGVRAGRDELTYLVAGFYANAKVAGVTQEDFVEAMLNASFG